MLKRDEFPPFTSMGDRGAGPVNFNILVLGGVVNPRKIRDGSTFWLHILISEIDCHFILIFNRVRNRHQIRDDSTF